LIIDCGIANLGLIVGPIRSLEPDNIKYIQKVKFFHHIKRIKANIVLLDLGAGTNDNIVDAFLLAEKKIIVNHTADNSHEGNVYVCFTITNEFLKTFSPLGFSPYPQIHVDITVSKLYL